MRENDFLKWIRDQTPTHDTVTVNIGDDMAAVNIESSLALLKTDQCLDQVHFDLRHHTATQAGRKAVNRCLSDCAAMACVPAAIMISVALPKEGVGSGEGFAKELFVACREAGAVFDCPLVGGDTSVWDQRLAITVSALGKLPAGQGVVTRAGAKAGDVLFVSGALGGSILGRHLKFTPRIELAQKIARAAKGGLHAMMDLSDGLAQDVPRMGEASGVGVRLHAGRLPIHEDAWRLSEKDSLPAGFHALADGEDYELLFALDPEAVPGIVNLSEVPLTAIGEVTADRGLVLIDEQGQAHPWPRVGWEHHT
jgi:thiamine-monophosphate kinase